MDTDLSTSRPTNSSAAVFGIVLLLSPALSAQPVRAVAPLSPPTATASEIAPHRAIYRMTLKSARNSSKVADVQGSMLFEWADACDGWTTEQRFQLQFVYAEGEAMNMNTSYTTWEGKNGQRYRFNVRKLVNGELDEEVRGEATVDSTGAGNAHFVRPEELDMPLPKGTLFPAAHTVAIIDHAQRNDRFFTATVFDGADAEGTTEISAVLPAPQDDGVGLTDPLVRGHKAWPVRMAFFPTDSDAAEPEYEMGIRLQPNGVATGMVIDYGDFTVDAILEKIEALPKPRC